MAPIMNFNNFELRSQFFTGKIFDQHLAFSAVPFFDFGGCWDNFTALNVQNYRYNSGLGLRIAWNVNTILRFDYAISKEDNQFFFQMNHTF
jgi:outer membrane protein assembly factor BamA